MLSQVFDRISFWSLFLVIVLMPVFFLPYTNIPIETSKGLLVVVGLAMAVIFWAMARFFDGEIILPRSIPLVAGAGMVLVFLLSAIFSGSSAMSMFGIMLDIGSFWFMFVVYLLMLFSAIIVIKEPSNAKIIFLGIIISSSAVLIFQALHLFFTSQTSLGILNGRIDNVFGSWNAFGVLAGFSSIISLFLLEFFSMSGVIKWGLRFLIVFSTILVATVNFQMVWILLGISSLLILVYKISFYSKTRQEENGGEEFPIFSLFIVMVSLLFFMSSQFLGGFIPNRLGLVNIDVSPNFQATMHVTKAVFALDPVLGMGPNRFADAWSMFKPAVVNNSSFWNTSFSSASGLLPTFAATTGSLGIISLIIFFCSFFVTGFKSLFTTLQRRTNQEVTAFFVASLYLFISSFFYSAGLAVIILAFAFAGIFIGLHHSIHKNRNITLTFLNDPRKGFFSIFVLVILTVITAALSFKYIERFTSVAHFRRALTSQTIPEAEESMNKALGIYSNDLYLRSYALIQSLKLNSLLAQNLETEEVKASLQNTYNNAVSGSIRAAAYNPENFMNYQVIGSIYESAAPVGTAGTYDRAFEAYNIASTLNPTNPGLKIAMARVSFANKKVAEAKDYANQALTLKPDYIDALLVLSQIASRENNKKDAVSFAEQALALAPTNESLIKYVNSVKNGTTTTPPQDVQSQNPEE